MSLNFLPDSDILTICLERSVAVAAEARLNEVGLTVSSGVPPEDMAALGGADFERMSASSRPAACRARARQAF